MRSVDEVEDEFEDDASVTVVGGGVVDDGDEFVVEAVHVV